MGQANLTNMNASDSFNRGECEARRVGTAVRDACRAAALEAYEHAARSGLCHEGAWECAMGAIADLDLEQVIHNLDLSEDASST